MQVIKATAHGWFNNHRNKIATLLGDDRLNDLDKEYRELIAASGRATTRSEYDGALKRIKKLLGRLQGEHVITLAADL